MSGLSNKIGIPYADWSYSRRVAFVASSLTAVISAIGIATLLGIDSGKLSEIHRTYTALLGGLGTMAAILFAATLLAPTQKATLPEGSDENA